MSLFQFLDEFAPDEASAETWFVERRWPNGERCAHCDSERVNKRSNRQPCPTGVVTVVVTFR